MGQISADVDTIAFASDQAVDELPERVRAADVFDIDGPRYTWDGQCESVMLDPAVNRIETRP